MSTRTGLQSPKSPAYKLKLPLLSFADGGSVPAPCRMLWRGTRACSVDTPVDGPPLRGSFAG